MGGRGKSSGTRGHQLTINDSEKRQKITDIIQENTTRRQQIIEAGEGGNSSSPMLLKKCVCCREYSIPINKEHEICPICGWVDDKFQNNHPNSLEGKNAITLSQAKKSYKNHH